MEQPHQNHNEPIDEEQAAAKACNSCRIATSFCRWATTRLSQSTSTVTAMTERRKK